MFAPFDWSGQIILGQDLEDVPRFLTGESQCRFSSKSGPLTPRPGGSNPPMASLD
jgi:hypothetical protein